MAVYFDSNNLIDTKGIGILPKNTQELPLLFDYFFTRYSEFIESLDTANTRLFVARCSDLNRSINTVDIGIFPKYFTGPFTK